MTAFSHRTFGKKLSAAGTFMHLVMRGGAAIADHNRSGTVGTRTYMFFTECLAALRAGPDIRRTEQHSAGRTCADMVGTECLSAG